METEKEKKVFDFLWSYKAVKWLSQIMRKSSLTDVLVAFYNLFLKPSLIFSMFVKSVV